jgi:hypothetical protein
MNAGRFRNTLIMLLAGITLPVIAGGSSLAAQASQAGPGPSAQTVKIAADGSDSGSFGVAVDLTADGSTAVVGAIAHNFDRGGAYIFQRTHGLWSKTADLTPPGLQYGDSFGNAVAISADGSLVMVGEVGWQQLTGRVLVFQRTAAGWAAVATLVAPDAASYSHFGDSISMDAAGNRAVIGALGVDGFVGRAYVFSRAQHGQWTETAELQPQQSAGQLDLGTSVSMSRNGSVVLAGANIYDDTAGAAYVFRYHGGRWTQQAMLTAGQPQAGAYFGTSVTLDAAGSEAVIGAVYENNGEGAAYVFQRGPGGWAQAARLSQPDAEQFGNAVAINDGGRIAEVGAEATQTTGTAYVYTKSRAVWSRAMTLKPDVSSQALYGIALAADASGGEVMVGAAFDDNGNPADTDYGAVYVVRV